jgi:hypothetical protein
MCLGHGDKENQQKPGRIDAFADKKVLRVVAGNSSVAALVEENRK